MINIMKNSDNNYKVMDDHDHYDALFNHENKLFYQSMRLNKVI